MARILSLLKCAFKCKRCHGSKNIFTFMDLFLIVLSIGSFLADIATDIIVIYQYYINGHFMWLILTTSLVCVPSVIVQIFSIRWFTIDGKATNYTWIFHVFQLGLFYRFLQLLQEGFKVRKSKSASDLTNFNHQQSDICMLRLFESFTESAPQLVLQLYIMVSTDDWNPWTGVSAVASIVSLSWGISTYSKAMRNIRPEKQLLSWWGLLFQAMWRIGMVSSRIVAMVLFAVAFGYWLILAIGVHWLSMVFWIFLQNTDFCTTWWEERLYNAVVGVIYCFCYFNIKEGRSRLRMTFFYSSTLTQNFLFAAAFYLMETDVRWKGCMALLVPACASIGLISMLLYYRFFHPSGPITWFASKLTEDSSDKPKCDVINAKCVCSTLKTCRKMVEPMTTVAGCKNVEDHPAPQDNQCIEKSKENLNLSKMSIELNVCTNDLHRSHSLNCSIGSYVNPMSEPQRKVQRKSLANHHRNINYNFRPAVVFGSLSSRMHCSCLILVNDSHECRHTTVLVNEQLSNSLPNFELSFQSEIDSEQSFRGNAIENLTSNTEPDCYSSTISGIYVPPVINKDHVIRIDVESEAT